jgi:hypothetical protein
LSAGTVAPIHAEREPDDQAMDMLVIDDPAQAGEILCELRSPDRL